MKILNTILILISLLSHSLIPELKILNGIFNFNLKEKKMTIRIRSIKDFNNIVYRKTLYFPSDKQLTNLNTKVPNNNIIKNSLMVNDYYDNKSNSNNNNNLSKNCLIGLDNTDNNSNTIQIINKRKHNSLVMIKERENEKSNYSNNNSEKRMSFFKGQKTNHYTFKNQYNNENNDNSNNNNVNNNDNNNACNNNNNNCNNDNKKKANNYIYRVGSFYPKFQSSQKNQNNNNNDNKNNSINNNLKNYSDQLYFNIFQYYCLGKCFKKNKEIELYKLGLSLYKKRMDIINVFTFLLFTEKNCLQAEENYP